MSKEKNLTYKTAGGEIATKHAHEWYGVMHGVFYAGPAIDRLHEFEKLGMEPEEIASMSADYPHLAQELKEIKDDLERSELACLNLRKERLDMQIVIANQSADISSLRKNLKEKSDPFHLTEACAALNSDNAKLKSMVERRDKEINELAEENARLRKNMEEMKKIVGPGDFEKEIKELKDLVEYLKSSNTTLMFKNAALAIERDDLKKKVTTSDDLLDKKNRYINSLEEANKELESENRKLWDKLERIECVLEEEE